MVSSEYDYKANILIIGDTSVGKSTFMQRFAENTFTTTTVMSSLGVDFKMKTIEVEGKRIKLQIWTTAGQERFRTTTRTYYERARGVILAYDCTNLNSFERIRYWD
jgi:Ras-related protein Rab-1A